MTRNSIPQNSSTPIIFMNNIKQGRFTKVASLQAANFETNCYQCYVTICIEVIHICSSNSLQ